MPAHPLEVETGTHPDSWDGFTAGTRLFPERLVELAKAKGWSRNDLAKHAGVNQGTISKWLNYQVPQPKRVTVARLEKKAGLEDGYLTREPETRNPSGRGDVFEQLSAWARRIGLDVSIVLALRDEELGLKMQQFRNEIQRAILGLVHVYGVSLEAAVKVAARVTAEHADEVGLKHATADYWYRLFVDERPRRNESGTHPSAGRIKLAKG